MSTALRVDLQKNSDKSRHRHTYYWYDASAISATKYAAGSFMMRLCCVDRSESHYETVLLYLIALRAFLSYMEMFFLTSIGMLAHAVLHIRNITFIPKIPLTYAPKNAIIAFVNIFTGGADK